MKQRTDDAYARIEPARRWLAAHDTECLALQLQLARTPAPTGDEGARAEVVRSWLHNEHLSHETDSVGNVLVPIPSSSRASSPSTSPVVVCAHLDTVFTHRDPHAFTTTGSVTSGPGIGDNARGLAGMLMLIRALRDADIQTGRPLLCVATVGEEGAGDLLGARHVFTHHAPHAAAAVILDGAGDDRVAAHAVGSRRLRITFTGAGGHSWASPHTPNPLHAAAHAAHLVARLPTPTSPRTSLTVTQMHAGHAINAIPAEAWLSIDVRSSSDVVLDRLERDIRAIAHRALTQELQLNATTAGLALEIALLSKRPAGATPLESDIVQSALRATELIGRVPEQAIASSDANIPMHLGIPAVMIGAGGVGGGVHTPQEWFENRDAHLGLTRALTVVAALTA